jgi:photosystem II stability/assembly factor-like uncharacterized protein
MKNLLVYLIILLLLSFSVTAQQSAEKKPVLPQKGKTFFDIQKSFNDYWAPFNVKNGYYTENGVQKKAPGWKQFKRWEYYWANRVNPVTGAFPKTTAADIYTNLNKQRGFRNSTGNWTELGPSSSPGGYQGIGRINCVGFRDGDNNTYYAGAPSGGLWKTTDNGANWTVLTDNNAVLGVSDVVVIAGPVTASDTIYIATGDRDGGSMWSLGGGYYNDNNSIGILKSVDGGTTWNTTGISFSASDNMIINKLLIDPTNHNVLYAAIYNSLGSSNAGLYKTTDGGSTWNKLSSNMYVDLEFKPGNSQVIYAGTKVGHIYRSTDAGVNWSLIVDQYSAGGRRVNLAVSAADATVVYAVMAKTDGGLFGVYKSSDSGNSFALVYDGSAANHNLLGWVTDGSDSGGQGGYDLTIAVDPSNANIVYVGGVNSHKSTNGGSTWTAVNCWTSSGTYNKNGAPTVHADKHMMKIRSSDNTLFETNDGGIYYTTDGGGSWTDKTNGIVPSQMYRLGVSATTSGDVITGLQDNGTKLYSGGTWGYALGGDGMECAIDYTDVNTQYGETPNGNIKLTTNHWSSYSYITVDPSTGSPTNGLNESGYWVTPYQIDPATHTTLYLGMNNVWKSTDQGSNWTKISTMSTSSKLRSLAVAPSNSQVIYTADPDQIWVTTNGGTGWTDVTGTLPVSSSSITYISVKYDDPSTAWVSLGQYNAYGVYQTTDGGSTWTDISSGLPQIPVMCVIQNRQNTSQTELYAGTDLGVYVKMGSGGWTAFNNGLPNVVVNELEIYYNDTQSSLSRLRAATSGRGLWESELYSPPNSPPEPEFTANIRIPTTSDSVAFTDLSINTPTSWLWGFSPGTITYKGGTSSTSQNPYVQFNAEGYYQVTLITTNANGSDSIVKSDYIHTQNYCNANGLGDIYIKSVNLGSINNEETGNDGYTDYDYLSTQLMIGSSNTITISFGKAYQNDTVAGWIDWNQDGDFDDTNEEVFWIDVYYYTESSTIAVPIDANLGFTRMRIRNKHFGDHFSPCGTTGRGEVEDYAIEVTPASTVWNGTTSNWNEASNWSAGVIPTSSYDVTIPASPSGGNFPTVPSGYTAKCNKLTLQGNATVTVNGILEIEQQ